MVKFAVARSKEGEDEDEAGGLSVETEIGGRIGTGVGAGVSAVDSTLQESRFLSLAWHDACCYISQVYHPTSSRVNLHSKSPCHTSQDSSVIDLDSQVCKRDKLVLHEPIGDDDLAELLPPGSLRAPAQHCDRQIYSRDGTCDNSHGTHR